MVVYYLGWYKRLITRRDVRWVRFTAKFARMDIGCIPPDLLIRGIVAQSKTW